ncbi:MAG: helix-turn-helix domain-containing protein [Oscillospiraceae bacterium]|nr:helix-turn-helix domain-containing protein [Oscillospiraceae bacterium]
MKTFAEKIRESRSFLDMSQEELAQKIEVSRRSVVAYEKGEKVPRERVVIKLAQVLGVSVKYLKDENCDDPKEDIELDYRISEISDRYGSKGVKDAEKLLDQNLAFFAGGEVPIEEKTAFFEAVMNAYVKCREQSKEKYGRKK